MTDQTNMHEDKKNRAPGSLYEAARRVLLAAIGAVAFAQDEVEDFINRLVERGEIAEKDGKRLLNEILDKRNLRKSDLETEVGERFHDTLQRLNIPTRRDLEDLGEKISALTRKVEELSKSKE